MILTLVAGVVQVSVRPGHEEISLREVVSVIFGEGAMGWDGMGGGGHEGAGRGSWRRKGKDKGGRTGDLQMP